MIKKNIRKDYTIRFFGVAIESVEAYNMNEAEKYLERNWEEVTKSLLWDIETEIEEGE